MAEDTDRIKEEIHKLQGKASRYSNEALQETDAAKRKILDDNVARLNQEIQSLADKLPVAGSAGAPKRFEQEAQERRQQRLKMRKAVQAAAKTKEGPKRFPAIEALDTHFQQMKQNARKMEAEEPARQERVQAIQARKQNQPVKQAVQEALKTASQPAKTVGKQVKSSSDKLADIALKEAQRAQQQARNPKLPQISKDTATELVIAFIVAIFLIQAGAGTKFSSLWQLAFNKKGSGPGDYVGAGPGDYTGQGPGGLPDESWDLPTSFHGLAS